VKPNRWVIALVAALAVWIVGYSLTHREPDPVAYRTVCVNAAQSALDGLVTAGTVSSEQQRLIDTYVTGTMNDAGGLLTKASTQLPGLTPPDQHSSELRDELTPLLTAANGLYGDAMRARGNGDAAGEQAAVARFGPIERKLQDFIDRNRSS
jgi:hypothetical protein